MMYLHICCLPQQQESLDLLIRSLSVFLFFNTVAVVTNEQTENRIII